MTSPDVLKRLEEIEGRGLPLPSEDYYWLLRTIHALLESQGELLEWLLETTTDDRSHICKMVEYAEKVRKGDL